MRKIILIIASLVVVNISFGQTKVSIDSVSTHMGEQIEVCSKVVGVKTFDKITFINLGEAYPNSPLTVVVFAKDYPNFKGSLTSLYEKKKICVTGVLSEYRGKPQIVVTKPEEIVVQ